MSKRDVIEALTGLGLAIVVVTFTMIVLARATPPNRVASEPTASASTNGRAPAAKDESRP
jgi:hypothetical protein